MSSGRTTAELWGSAQWDVLTRVIRERRPKRIALNIDTTFAFADGLTLGEYTGMLSREVLKPEGDWKPQITTAGRLAVDLIAIRQAEEEATFDRMNRLTWDIITEAFSNRVVTPGVTRTSDVVWWMRQRVADLGLTTWFQPSVDVQRRGTTDAQLGDDPIIQKGDVLHCDFGITAMRLNTDTQHMGYVLLKAGENGRAGGDPEGAGYQFQPAAGHRVHRGAQARSHRQRHPEGLALHAHEAPRSIDGTVYSHPIGLHGHGAGVADRACGTIRMASRGAATHARSFRGCGTRSSCRRPPRCRSGGNQPVRSMGQEEDVIHRW